MFSSLVFLYYCQPLRYIYCRCNILLLPADYPVSLYLCLARYKFKSLILSFFFSVFFSLPDDRTNNFHHFVKLALTKNPKKRPTAEKLLQVSKKTAYLQFFNTNRLDDPTPSKDTIPVIVLWIHTAD